MIFFQPSLSFSTKTLGLLIRLWLVMVCAANVPQAGAAVPEAPANLSVTMLGANWLQYTWQDVSDNEANFTIDYFTGVDWVQVAVTGPNQTTYNLILNDALPGGVGGQWLWRARSGNAEGYSLGSSNEVLTSNPAPVFDAPTSLSSIVNGDSRVLTWSDNSNLETGYKIEYSLTPGTWTVLGNVGPTASIGSVSSLSLAGVGFAPNSTVSFRVRAVRSNPEVFTAYSNETSVTMPSLAAPSNLAFSLPAGEQVSLTWTDNSSNEGNYEIQARLVGTTNWSTLAYRPANTTSIVVSGVRAVPVEFQVRATAGGGPDYFSGFSGTVTATANTIAPTGLVSTILGEQSVRLNWTDNSTAEDGYIIQARLLPSGSFFDVGSTGSDATTITLNETNLPYPGIGYEFQVLTAYVPGTTPAPVVRSAPSNAVQSTLNFNAPTQLTATNIGETTVNLAWTDNSSVESKYVVLRRRPGAAQWTLLTSTLPNVTTYSATGNSPGTQFEFAVVAVFTRATNDELESELSNILPVTTLFNAPTGFQAQLASLTETSVTLVWVDNSVGEQAYEILRRPAGSTAAAVSMGFVSQNVTSSTQVLQPGVSYEFFVRAAFDRGSGDLVYATSLDSVTVTAKDGMTSPTYIELRRGIAMTNYTLTTTTTSAVVTSNISGLPSGLTFNAGVISGTPTGTGITKCPVVVTFANGWTHNNSLAIRILDAPVATNPIPAQNLTLGEGAVTINLTDKFTDPDASSAVRVKTNLTNPGYMDFILFDAAAPLHVANFMGYVNRGDYTNTVFHRSISGFISQAGAFRTATGPTAFTKVATQAPVTNEPGISNVRGTVALAKVDGDPSSGTNQFFVNTANNGPNLDFQNGGFTVFARVTAPGMKVVDSMARIPRGTYSVTVDSTASTFTDYPSIAETPPATLDNTKSVKILSASSIPTLTYIVLSNSNSSAVTASIVNGGLLLTPVALGTSTIVIRATDLEFQSVTQSFVVTVTQPSMGSIVEFNGSSDELLNYALLTEGVSPSVNEIPPPANESMGPNQQCGITFKVRNMTNLDYSVEASDDLTPSSWTTIWKTTDGFNDAHVESALDYGEYTLVTIRDTDLIPSSGRRFLRIKVTAP